MKYIKGFGAVILLILLDQLTKYLAVTRLAPAGEAVLIPGVLSLYYHENRGAVWGLMQGSFHILSVVTMALSNIIMMKSSGQEMQGSMKWMPWMMSLMFVWIAFTVPVAFSLYYTVSNVLMLITSVITRKMYDPEKMKAQVAAEIEEKKKTKKAKKQVKVVDEKTGEEKLKEVTEAEMNRLRIERARAIDAELYKDERTTPLNAKTGEEESCEK